jgi:hypothetical protein
LRLSQSDLQDYTAAMSAGIIGAAVQLPDEEKLKL